MVTVRERVSKNYAKRGRQVKAYDILKQEVVEFRANGYLAVVLQHEIDHLNGILFYDRINREDPWKLEENTLVIEA